MILAHDLIIAGCSFPLALWIRHWISENSFSVPPSLLNASVFFVLISFIVFAWLKVYKGAWRFVSKYDVVNIVQAVSISILLFLFSLFLLNLLDTIPRSIPIIHWLILICLLVGSRFSYRFLKETSNLFDTKQKEHTLAVLIGVGPSAEAFLRNITKQSSFKIIALIDDTNRRINTKILGIPVVSNLEQIETWFEKNQKKYPLINGKLIIADMDLDNQQLKRITALAELYEMTVSRLSKVTEFVNHEIANLESIHIEELLGRKTNSLNLESARSMISGKNIMITGAGGSIGSELIKQICALNPAHIALIDDNEFALYNADMLVKEALAGKSSSTHQTWLVDVCDYQNIEKTFKHEKPDFVWHAAALKHVPIVEKFPIKAIEINVLGTRNIANLCKIHNVRTMILISTDKAVHPSSIMGATKRLAEAWIQSLDQQTSQTCFAAVRFGNVLGSTGSVVPLFKRQLNAGGPLTVTDPEMTRYFMSISEAVQLVLQATVLANEAKQKKNKSAGNVYILEMGEPVCIDDLARKMIRLSGLRPDKDISVQYTGLRDGEKLHEQLLHETEIDSQPISEKLIRAMPRTFEYSILQEAFIKLQDCCLQNDVEKALTILHQYVPEYKSTKTKNSI